MRKNLGLAITYIQGESFFVHTYTHIDGSIETYEIII